MIRTIAFALLFYICTAILRKFNITGWKAYCSAFVMTMLFSILLMLVNVCYFQPQINRSLDNKYFSIEVPDGYRGEVVKQYEPAGYSVVLCQNNTSFITISVANYDITDIPIEDCLMNFITTNPQIVGKLDKVPTFNNCTILGQSALETQFNLQGNNISNICFRAKNGMFYYSTAFNISLIEHKKILETLNIKETKVEYVDAETFFMTCYQ